MKSIRTFSELSSFGTFEERFEYLKLGGLIGERTFGGNRYLNQAFYRSREWRKFRDQIILRDNGCDLGIPGYELNRRVLIHHLNPLTEDDFRRSSAAILDPENVITVSFATHEAIHYGNRSLIVPELVVERKPNDTCPWKGAGWQPLTK